MHLAKLCFVNVEMHAVGRSGRKKQQQTNKENVIGKGEKRICWGALCNIKSTLKCEKNCCDEGNAKHSHSDNSLSNSLQE